MFYVSHMNPIKRARVHRGDCRDCNEGRGQLGQHKTGSGNTGWSQGFQTYEDALHHMLSNYGHFRDKRACRRCKPSSSPG